MGGEITWPGWKIIKRIGTGSYGSVYEIQEPGPAGRKAALKVISVPASREELEHGYYESWYDTEEDARTFFRSQVDEMTKEISIMARLKGNRNIVSFDDYRILPHEDGIGADILIRMELLTPLDKYCRKRQLTEDKVIQLGLDICGALEACQAQNPPILHRDIKTANVMIDAEGTFKLGDFGVSKVLEGTRHAHTIAGTESFMAPEVIMGTGYEVTADLYSLGIVLYRMLNNNRGPFLPPEGVLSMELQGRATGERLGGETPPAPFRGSDRLRQTVLKAIAPDPASRFQTPAEMRRALELCRTPGTERENWMPPEEAGGRDQTPQFPLPGKTVLLRPGVEQQTGTDDAGDGPRRWSEDTVCERTDGRGSADSGGRHGMGPLGAVLGALAAAILWIPMSFLPGAITCLAGLITAVFVLLGCRWLGGRIDRKGKVICAITILCAVYLSQRFSAALFWVWHYRYDLSYFPFLFANMEQMANLNELLLYTTLAYAFALLGAFLFFRKADRS